MIGDSPVLRTGRTSLPGLGTAVHGAMTAKSLDSYFERRAEDDREKRKKKLFFFSEAVFLAIRASSARRSDLTLHNA